MSRFSQLFSPQGREATETRWNLIRIGSVNIFSAVGCVSLLVFGLVHIQSGSVVLGAAELFCCFVAAVNISSFWVHHSVEVSGSIILCMMVALLAVLHVTGGLAGTGYYWFFTYPILVFALKGSRRGVRWMFALVVVISLLVFANHVVGLPSYYSLIETRQLFAGLLAVSLLLYFAQRFIEDSFNEILHQDKLIEDANKRYSNEVRIVDENSVALEAQTSQLEDTKRAILNVLEDVEEDKNKLVEKEKLLEEAQRIGKFGNFTWNPVSQEVFWSDESFRIHGWVPTADHVPPPIETWFGIIHPDDLQATKDDLQKAMKDNDEHVHVYRVRLADGGERSVRVTSRLTKAGGSSVLKGTFQDVTKEQEIDRAKTEFVSLASHQLRTPLSTINWYAEMLLAGDAGEISKDQRQYLDEIYRGNQRMVELVNSLLNVSRLELGTFMVEPEMIDVVSLARDVVKESLPDITQKALVVREKYDDAIGQLNVDPKLMRMVFQNIISNAVKYTPENGQITIDVVRVAQGGVVGGHAVAIEGVLFSVADTGYGIPEAQQGRIFSKLFRADNVREMDTVGTGLGLYIVKSIMKQVGGEVWFVSTATKGSTFYVLIPIAGMAKKEGSKALG